MKAKRFWEKVEVRKSEDGFLIALDERILKTPNKNDLIISSEALANAVAQEWEAVEGQIDPNVMPMTRLTNSALERIPAQRAEIETHLLEYLESDLISYRADAPLALVERQHAWDEWVEWAAKRNIHLNVTQGVMAIEQPASNREMAQDWLGKLSDFKLMAFYEFLTLTGSFIFAMAICEDALEVEHAFDLSRIDDDYQAEAWGAVEEKTEERAAKLEAILNAARFLDAIRPK